MRIAVLGAGGIGGYYGSLLAKAGHDVVFVARGAHLEAMQRRGLTVRTQMLRRDSSEGNLGGFRAHAALAPKGLARPTYDRLIAGMKAQPSICNW